MEGFKKYLKELFQGWKTIPNFLSFMRILLIPVFAVLLIKDHFILAVIVIAIAELTDWFDGMLARKLNQVSALGKVLDPIADKLSQISIVIVLIFKYSDNAIKYLFMFFIAKEIIMVVGGLILIINGFKPFAAEIWGKLATLVFCVVMITVLAVGENGALCEMLGFTLPNAITWILVGISAAFTLGSLFGYAPGFIKQLKEKNAKNEESD
ncbi:MAG: CDP-alcohol phosphatidyltransferase family protein [Eubacterium sp.]|nr:CDP-alcohol phosphatidyltransferase family protein [Eubacterium sp.]